jgi:outer membrane protein assembly factor BamE (lipoprotein component of BamABCDE complex)
MLFVILIGCQLQDTKKTHGIIYLENRSKALNVNDSNKNDVIKILGKPQIKSFDDDDTWIYAERLLTKGKIHKLGKNVLKENNILTLKFDKYGILIDKKFFDKTKINKISFSKKITENDITEKSFITTFLESVRQKMYENKK